MTIDPADAAASLRDIASVEQRTRQTIFYATSGWILMLWGAVSASSYVITEFLPRWTAPVWGIAWLVGLVGTVGLIAGRRRRQRTQVRADWRIVYAMVVLMGYAQVFIAVLSPTYRQIDAFQPMIWMFGFVLGGIWVGRHFIGLGLVGTCLILLGYFGLGPWFHLWMALVQGVTLILGGLGLRRIGEIR
ncbi:MAG: hypothetical protein JWL84_4832 [Rhodospirillales bacterium]|nr:hypothetical protein [Rhodospirillales bacterium]